MELEEAKEGEEVVEEVAKMKKLVEVEEQVQVAEASS